MSETGEFVVSWTSENQDGTAEGIYARQYDSVGNPIGNEFLVNTTTSNDQRGPSVDIDDIGNFVVAWEGEGPGDSDGIFARRFDAVGNPLDPNEFRVNSSTSGSQNDTAVAMTGGGAFVVVWDDSSGFHFQRYDAAGNTQGGQTTVDANFSAGNGSVAVLGDGSFVVTWRKTVFDQGVYMRRYDSNGVALNSEEVVNVTTFGNQTSPSIAMDPAGSFIIAWEGVGTGDSDGVFFRKYDSGGAAISGEQLINETTSGTQHQVSLIMHDQDNFVAVWSGNGDQAGEIDSDGVFARQYGMAGGAPTADAGGPYVITEGSALTLDGSLSFDPDLDPLMFAWDLDNDGNFGEPGEPTTEMAVVPWSTLQSFGISDDGGPITIGLWVDDGNGGLDTATATLTVNNAAPTLTATGSGVATNGSAYMLTLGATDPGADTISSWTINWGDGTIETIAGNPTSASHSYSNVGFTNDILVAATDEDGTHHAGDLITTSLQTNSVMRFRAADGSFLQEIGAGSVGSPVDVAIGPDGGIYVTGFGSDTIARFAPDGLSGFDFVTSGDGGLSAPSRLAFGSDGNLYVTSLNTDQVLRYSGSTGAFIDVFADSIGNSLDEPDGIVFGPDGELYVASKGTGEILRFDGSSGDFDQVFAVQGTVGYMDIQFGPDGHLWVSNQSSDDVRRFDGTTGIFLSTFTSTGAADFAGFAFGADNQVYLADAMVGDKIVRYPVSDGNAPEDFILSGTEGLDQPVNIVFTPAQQVLILNGLPTFTSPSSVTVPENQVSALTITATDPETDPLAFSISGGVDAAFFSIMPIGSSAASLTFQIPPDFEAPGDAGANNVYQVTVDVTDGFSNVSQLISVTVSNVDESPVANAGGPYSVTEGGILNLNGSASDPEMGPLTFDWDIDNDGQFDDAFGAAPNVPWAILESISVNDDGVYPVRLRVTDSGSNTDVIATTLTINNAPPNAAPNGGPGFVTNEASAFVTGNVLSNDSDPSSADTLSVVGQTSATGLVVDNGNGTFAYNPNGQFETLAFGQQTTDTFSYTLADDDGGTSNAAVTINGRNDAPTDISISNLSVFEEAAGAVIGAVFTTDVDSGDSHSYVIDDPRFEVAGGQLKLRAADRLDFEIESTVLITVTSTDSQEAVYNEPFLVTVTDVNDNAPAVDPGQLFSVLETAPNGTSLGFLTAADADAGTTFSNWTIAGGNTDGIFSINPQPEVIPETAADSTATDEIGPIGGTPGGSSTTTTKTNSSNSDRGGLSEADSTGRSAVTGADGFQTERISREQLAQSLRFRGEDLSFLVKDEYIAQVESIDEELQFEAPVPEWAIGSAVVTTTSLSVGYIVWMVRGGYILASVLSTMPVWQNIDPLPVLDALDSVDDDGESLESMIDAVEENGSAENGMVENGPSPELDAGPLTNETSGVA
jgi:VCBS repeat-containing protein